MNELENFGEKISDKLSYFLKRLHPQPLPYQRLLIKLLSQALDDWFTNRDHVASNNGFDPKKAAIAENAYAWIMSDVEWFGIKKGRRGGTISFISVCQALDFNHDSIRQVLHVRTFEELEQLGRVYLSSRSRGGDSEDTSGWNPTVVNRRGFPGCGGRGQVDI